MYSSLWQLLTVRALPVVSMSMHFPSPVGCLRQMLEKKVDDELSHVRQLEDEKSRVEAERRALEQGQKMLEAQKSQAELEKVHAIPAPRSLKP